MQALLLTLVLGACSQSKAEQAGSQPDVRRAVEELAVSLPRQHAYGGVVWNAKEHEAYLFGGGSGEYARQSGKGGESRFQSLADILRFTAQSLTVGRFRSRFPGRGLAFKVYQGAANCAAWDEGSQIAYIFGGAESESTIRRFDPAADKLQALPTKLPCEIVGGCAVWRTRASSALILGGQSALHLGPSHFTLAGQWRIGRRWYYAHVLAFSPAAASVAVVGSLPCPRYRVAAAYAPDSDVAYVIGGLVIDQNREVPTDTVCTYEAGSGTAVLWSGHLPQPLCDAAAVWDSRNRVVWVIGGRAGNKGKGVDTILKLDPANGTVSDSGWKLPRPSMHVAAVMDPDAGTIWIFAGKSILRFTPPVA